MTTTVPGRPVTTWRSVTLVGVAFAVTMVGTTLPTPLYPIYAEQFAFGELMTTVVFATYAVGVTAGLLLFGHWSDQLGRRPLLLAGLGLSAVSAIAFLLPGALGWLFVGRFVSGVSAGIVTGTATATIVDLAPDHGQARAGLVAAAVNMAGLGVGPLLAGVLAQYAPWPVRLCFVVDLVLVAIGVLCVLGVEEPVHRSTALSLRPRALRLPPEIRAVFTRAAIAGFAGFAVLGLFTAVSPAFLGQVLGEHNKALIGAVVLVTFASSVAGQTQSGRLGLDRALLLGCVALIVGMVVVGTGLGTHVLVLLVLGAVVAGYGQGLSFRAGLSSVADASPPEQRGEITSTFFVVLYVGISIPVIGEGALAAQVGLITAGVVFAGLVAALALAALVLLQRSRR